MARPARYDFAPANYEREIISIVEAIHALDDLDGNAFHRILRKFPKDGRGLFSKSEIIRGFRHFASKIDIPEEEILDKLRMKPVRTASGVAPVTVLTKPFPCPGKCIFCPNDVRMPKSYLAMEPGAQRATQNSFDPYAQTRSRLHAFHVNGHRIDKVELIILGGTWSFYPEDYRVWFIKRCFDAMNDFFEVEGPGAMQGDDFLSLEDDIRAAARPYNDVVGRYLRVHNDGALTTTFESATWAELERAHAINEQTRCRCVGLVVETRPDHLDDEEIIRIRRLGATKVQIGFQSLSDEILEANKRGHTVAATRLAMRRLRRAGFKIHAHWMPNLHGASPDSDIEDFSKLFGDADFRPDELKVYPCSLIESAELMQYYEDGRWRPYTDAELYDVLGACLPQVPEYCRTTRVIRDIPSHDIVVGNKHSNFREMAEAELSRRGATCIDIRSREIRTKAPDELELDVQSYDSGTGREVFFQWITHDRKIAGFCRLALPDLERSADFVPIAEIENSAIIREVHVYGPVVGLGKKHERRAQHVGLGKKLVELAKERAKAEGYERLAVISAIGTRDYYRKLGFADGELYMQLDL